MQTFYYLIQGRVQGVAFRYYTKKEAHKLNIRGTVKNLFNRDVEVYAQGEEQALSLFEEFLKTGPTMAHIRSVKKELINIEEIYKSFEIIC